MDYEEKCRPLLQDFDSNACLVPMVSEKGRSSGLHKGAAAVMVLWPEHATTSAIIATLSGLGLILLTILAVIFACETTPFPRCIGDKHNSSPLHDCVFGHPNERKINAFEKLAQQFQNRSVRITVFVNTSEAESFQTDEDDAQAQPYITMYEESMNKYPNINYTISDVRNYFQRSILFSAWKKLDLPGILLECRALAVWNYGGTALDTDVYVKEPTPKKRPTKRRSIMAKVVAENRENKTELQIVNTETVINIPEADLNSAVFSRDGSLLSTDKQCHAFAWEILFMARIGTNTAEDIIADALRKYCRGRVNQNCRGVDII